MKDYIISDSQLTEILIKVQDYGDNCTDLAAAKVTDNKGLQKQSRENMKMILKEIVHIVKGLQ